MRKTIVAGNWKMNKTASETRSFLKGFLPKVAASDADVVFAVPGPNLAAAVEAAQGSAVAIAAQNMHAAEKGAFTGEISAAMLKDLGVTYVILGHSERRQYFAETDENVNRKLHSAHAAGIRPIVCVGESLSQREQSVTMEVVRLQVKIAFQGLSASRAANTIIAYEPIWAIGTGKTATSQQAQEVCSAIRRCIAEIYSEETADALRIQYGGSVTPGNAAELFGMPDIDGGLVGGASLKPDFEKIVNY